MLSQRKFRICLFIALLCNDSGAWLPAISRCQLRGQFGLYYSLGNGGDNSGDGNDQRSRMEIVRSLQSSFYKSSSSESKSSKSGLDLKTGIFHDLPLWRVPWSEVPGRTNVLNVHEPMYTNMFETVLRSDPPWYVGHLYLPQGSDNPKKTGAPEAFRLKTWKEAAASEIVRDNGENIDETATEKKNCSNSSSASSQKVESSAVVGTLLRVTDYRRMTDGRLLLLVQAMERFVVNTAVRELPYSVADVQLVPDSDELPNCGDGTSDSNWVTESFLRWHRYEYGQTMLPLPLESELPDADMLGSALREILPYSPFSPVIDVTRLAIEPVETIQNVKRQSDHEIRVQDGDLPTKCEENDQNNGNSFTLEDQWIQGKILLDPTELIDTDLMKLPAEELEARVWLAVDEFLKRTKKPVSPILLGLIPRSFVWPKTFVLERIADALESERKISGYVRVSPDYPAERRRKRLSYSAAALLEDTYTVTEFRQQLLKVPSTKARLAWILERMEIQNYRGKKLRLD